jgi:hypothetical protein
LKDKDETDAIIDSMINIYGAPLTQAMKSLKKRLQDELRRVTEGRRKRIEEIEEILFIFLRCLVNIATSISSSFIDSSLVEEGVAYPLGFLL